MLAMHSQQRDDVVNCSIKQQQNYLLMKLCILFFLKKIKIEKQNYK